MKRSTKKIRENERKIKKKRKINKMKKKQGNNLKKNITYQIFYQILVIVVPLITSPYISRVLGAEGLGEYSYTYAVANYFVLISMLGLLNYGNREIAQKKDEITKKSKTFWEIYMLHLIIGLIVFGIYIFYVFFFARNYKIVALMQGVFVFSSVIDISWFYFGIEKFKLTTAVSAINKVLTTALIFILVKSRNDVYIYTLIIAGGTFLNNVMYWCYLKKEIIFIKPSLKSIKKHLKPLLILFIPVIAVSVYKYMDKIMIGQMMSSYDVGIYEAAEKFINLPMCIIAALGTVMLPRITNMRTKEESEKIGQYNYISMIMVTFLSIGMAFGIASISNVFIPWFYGKEFEESARILFILSPSIIFVSWASVIRTQFLLPYKRDAFYCISVIIGAIMNFAINYMLIPKIGVAGAAIGTTFTELTVSIVQTIYSTREMNVKAYLKDSMPFIINGIIMCFLIYHISIASILGTIIIKVLTGVLIYTILSLVQLKRRIMKFRKWEL